MRRRNLAFVVMTTWLIAACGPGGGVLPLADARSGKAASPGDGGGLLFTVGTVQPATPGGVLHSWGPTGLFLPPPWHLGTPPSDVGDAGTTGSDAGPLQGFTQVAMGGDHTCGIVNGAVACWGDNSYEQIGTSAAISTTTPIFVSGLPSPATGVAAGLAHSCAIAQGRVFCWGWNAQGELGSPLTNYLSATPLEVDGLPGAAQGLAAGGQATCAIVDGQVWCWGIGLNGVQAIYPTATPVLVEGLSQVALVAIGPAHKCAVSPAGVQCWGQNSSGELGNGSKVDSATPVAVVGLDAEVEAISVGTSHTCAVSNGAAFCWGSNTFGELGNGSTGEALLPTPVSGLSSGVGSISAGYHFSCTLVDGAAQCWGLDDSGSLGDGAAGGSTLPQPVVIPAPLVALGHGADRRHTCVLASGDAWCWGTDSSGQIGNGTRTYGSLPVLVAQ
jgi:alpha-tubulin suppressor-like RCC1 family protein